MLIQLHVCSTTQFINSDFKTTQTMSYLTIFRPRTYHNFSCHLLFKFSKRPKQWKNVIFGKTYKPINNNLEALLLQI